MVFDGSNALRANGASGGVTVPDQSPKTAAILTNGAYSLSNFRGPLIKAMVNAGVRVYALAPDFDDYTRQAVVRLGAVPVDVSMERTGLSPVRDLGDTMGLYRTLRRLKPDMLFSYFIKPVIYGSIAARLAGVPRRYALVAGLGYIFGSDDRNKTPKRRALRLLALSLYGLAFRACQTVFFQNQDDVQEFVDAGILPAAKAYLLEGTGIDLNVLAEVPPPTSPATFLLMGRLLREKGIVEFAGAAKIVHQKYPDARFVLLGGLDPNPGGLSQAEVEGMVVDSGMEWLGHVNDVKSHIAASSVYVLPSYYREGKPRSTQEAMAVGRAVITTDSPGCRDTVVPGVNGFIVPARDADALAAAMCRFIEEPDLIVTMGRESRRLAEERYDVHKINRQMLQKFSIAT
ncbi:MULTISPECIES: glycosyltransferase family 4 protein [unclassified Sphingomonas]|uniref:glycosyltransferase family 4 protein n=1 Tax=unclassified Sphingomonas TaxID=196159 RepID=UPI001F344374|nr:MULTISPECIES: glycosyltransferase family 4 protein [unclassified Sphingomonas]